MKILSSLPDWERLQERDRIPSTRAKCDRCGADTTLLYRNKPICELCDAQREKAS